MSAFDQLEVIGPRGEIRFYDLDPGKGLTNIGRHPENDIVIDSPDVEPFHALLDHRQKPFQLLVFGQVRGQKPPAEPRPLRNWDTVELDGYTLILFEGLAGARPRAVPENGARPRSPSTSLAATQVGAAVPGPEAASPSAPHALPLAGLLANHELAPALRAALDEDNLERLYGQMARLPADHADDFIVVEFTAGDYALDTEKKSSLDFSVEVRQIATCQATIINGGDIVANFEVNVQGLEPSWVTIFPEQVNLNEGERATVRISLNAPRLPTSRAGGYFFSVVVTSPDYPGRSTSLGGILLIKPYYEFAVGELSPKQQTISWSKAFGQFTVPIINKGNSEAAFRLDMEDDERACRFEVQLPGEAQGQVRQADVSVPADSARDVPVRITPNRRRLVALSQHLHSYSATVTQLAGQNPPRTLAGQARSAPLIGPWTLGLSLLLLTLLVVLVFRPRINTFEAEYDGKIGNFATPVVMNAGNSLALKWDAPPFVDLRIDPDVGAVNEFAGTRVVTPTVDTIYRLTASNLLTLVNPEWFTAMYEVPVLVTPIQPTVYFTPTVPTGTFTERDATIVRGQSVTLSWEVHFAETLLLLTNNTPETISPATGFGSRTVTPDQDTVYVLRAINRYTPPDGVTYAFTVKVVAPTATLPPAPVIQRFDVQPLKIIAGESVVLNWDVTGVSQVTIQGLDGPPLAPAGSVPVFPQQTTTFILSATNGSGKLVQLSKTVVVEPAPTDTPQPQAPRVEYFTATPGQVVQGSPQASAITLAWSVVGDTTGIEISGPNINPITNLAKQGTITIAAAQTTLYILTARNGTLAANQTVAITVLPPPTPTLTPTPSPTPVPQAQLTDLSAKALNTNVGGKVTELSRTVSDLYYDVAFDTLVLFNWVNVGGTTVNATFDGQPVGTTGSISRTVSANVVLELKAFNIVGSPVSYKFHLNVVPKDPPEAPTNLDGPALPAAAPISLNWLYSVPSLNRIIGFRVYRSTPSNPTPTQVAELLLPNPPPAQPFVWQDPDPNPSVCGRSYVVVAIYPDLGNPKQETPPSNSWNTQPCP